LHDVPMQSPKGRVSLPWTNSGTARNPLVASLMSLKTGGQQWMELEVALAAVVTAAAGASQVPRTFRRCAWDCR
jgi:hypothetical protein